LIQNYHRELLYIINNCRSTRFLHELR